MNRLKFSTWLIILQFPHALFNWWVSGIEFTFGWNLILLFFSIAIIQYASMVLAFVYSKKNPNKENKDTRTDFEKSISMLCMEIKLSKDDHGLQKILKKQLNDFLDIQKMSAIIIKKDNA